MFSTRQYIYNLHIHELLLYIMDLHISAKQQRHLLTHVEIWLGDGPKTIGARWNNGKVQVFDHYKFDAMSYHSPIYILKSIDTWLEGVCQRFANPGLI